MKNFILSGVFVLLNSFLLNCFSQTFNPTAAANGFNVFIKNNTVFQGGQTEASVAMGGNATLQGQTTIAMNSSGAYPSGLNNSENFGLVIGGQLIYSGGNSTQLNNGYLRIGSATGSYFYYQDCNNSGTPLRVVAASSQSCNTMFNSYPRLELQRQQTSGTATMASNLNYTASFNTLQAKSQVMSRYIAGSSLASSLSFPQVYYTPGSTDPRITLVQGKVNVLNLTGAQFANLKSLTFDNKPSANTPLIFNINQTGSYSWDPGNFGGLGNTEGAFMLYNFYNATGTITMINSNPVFGTVFAPTASFAKTNNNIIHGQVIASNFVLNNGLVAYYPFSATLPDDTKDPATAIYRTKKTGVFSLASTWLYNPYGDTFIDAVTPPAATNIAYVMPGHILTLDVNYTVGATGSFTINNTGSMVVSPNIVFTVSGPVNFNNQKVTFRSDVNGTGILGKVTGTLTNATNVEAEHYFTARRSYRFVTPGVTATGTIRDYWQEGGATIAKYGTHITGTGAGTNGFDWTQTNNASLYTLNNTTQGWSAVTNTLTAGTLTTGSAYRLMVRGDRLTDMSTNTPTPTPTTLRVTGTIKTGNYTPVLNSGIGKYSFVGNPYLSPINWEALYNASTGISPSFGVWDATVAGTNGRGAYVSYNTVSRTNSNPSTSKVDANIQSGQAILVTNTATTPAMTFREDYKTTTNRNVFRTTGASASKMTVQLLLPSQVGSTESTDGFVAVFADEFSAAIHEEDSYKLTNLDENIAIDRNGQALSIEGRPTISTNDTLPVKMWQLADTSYVLKIEGSEFEPTLSAFLRDNYLKKDIALNLSGTTTISFQLSDAASKAADRFTIIFRANTTLPVTVTDVKGYQKGKGVQVEWISRNETNIAAYEVERSATAQNFTKVGTVQASGNNSAAINYSFTDLNPSNGTNLYRIKIIEKSGAVRYTEIINVSINNNNNGVSFYPNPVTGSTINVQMSNMAKGTYTVNIVNALGQVVQNSTIEHQGGSATQALDLEKGQLKGICTVQIFKGEVKINQPVVFQ